MVTTTEINVTTGVRTVTEDYGDGTDRKVALQDMDYTVLRDWFKKVLDT